MKRFYLSTFFCFLLASSTCFSQGEIPVNFYTGTPGIFVNLYTVTDHDLSDNLTMSYDANSGSAYGYGWSLVAGGSVTRQVRGLPDDFADATRTGWLYNNNYSYTSTFPASSDSDPNTYNDELSDFNFINGLQYLRDTEPDIFSYSIGGVSGKFLFNNSGTISLIPYQDISITPTYSGSEPANKTITGWTITTNKGITYTLNDINSVTRTLTKSDTKYYNAETSMSIFERDFRLYNTSVNYAYSWMLTTVQSFTGAQLNYSYTVPITNTITKARTAEIIDPDNSTIGGQTIIMLMDETNSVTSKTLNKVAAQNGPWAAINGTSNVVVYDPLKSSTVPLRTFTFGYHADQPALLASIQESSQCASMPLYTFTYNIPPISIGPPVDEFNAYRTPIGVQQDLWGYSNGQTFSMTQQQFPTIYIYPNEPASERYRIYRIPNYSGTEIILNGTSNRNPNGQFPTLQRIVYPTGGETDLEYQSNMYRDTRTNSDAFAGGVRVSSVSYYDGVNPLSRIVKSYIYTDDAGHSSGRLLKRPTYAVPVWEYISPAFTYPTSKAQKTKTYGDLLPGATSNLWRALTLVTDFDISDDGLDGPIVGYAQVTVMRNQGEYAVYNYYVPGAYGDAATGSGSTDWAPTSMKFTRPSNMEASLVKTNNSWLHPAFPTQMYGYEQGLVWKKSEYNKNNVLVRTTNTTYKYVFANGTSPTPITALAYDKFSNSSPTMYLYGKYKQLADVAKVTSTETVTTYDENNTGLSSTQLVQQFYDSPYHRYVSRVNTTTPDNTVYGTSFQYVQDYPFTGTPTDSTLSMIKLLNDQHRTATLVEQVSTVLVSSGTEKTTGAALSIYRPVVLNGKQVPLLKWQMSYRPDAPGSFTKSYSSGNVFYRFNDVHYQTINTINEYDAYGLPISSTGENRVTTGTLWGYGQRQPVATFSQARSTNIGFSDFETMTVSSFLVTNRYNGTGRTGLNGVHPFATLTRTIGKSTNSYILSFWAKPASGNTSISLQVSLNGTSTTYTFNYTPGVSNYQYFTKAIDVTSMPSTFTVVITGQGFTQPPGSSPSLLPLLDDIGFYPDYAAISSVTYQLPYGVNSSTDASGVTSFSSYDSLGRVMLVSDQDHNIRQRYTYAFTGQVTPTFNPTIDDPITLVNTSFHFTAYSGPCITNMSYSWDIDNHLVTGTGPQSPTLSYNTTGSHTVTLQASHPDFGTRIITKNFSVVTAPPPPIPPVTVVITYTTSGGLTTFTPIVSGGDESDDAFTSHWFTRTSGGSWTDRGTSTTYTNKILPGTSMDVMCTITTAANHTATATVTVSN